MPNYDYKCESCGKESIHLRSIAHRDDPIQCEVCGSNCKRRFVFTKNRDWFRAHWNDDITGTPIYIDSKKQYKRICKENGVMAKCLL